MTPVYRGVVTLTSLPSNVHCLASFPVSNLQGGGGGGAGTRGYAVCALPTLSSEILASLEEYSLKRWSEPACRREAQFSWWEWVKMFLQPCPLKKGGCSSCFA